MPIKFALVTSKMNIPISTMFAHLTFIFHQSEKLSVSNLSLLLSMSITFIIGRSQKQAVATERKTVIMILTFKGDMYMSTVAFLLKHYSFEIALDTIETSFESLMCLCVSCTS